MTDTPGPANGGNPAILPTREGYDLWSQIYDADDNPLVALETAEVARHLTNLSGLTVADIGCGTGRHALAFAAAGARVTAVDFSEGMLAKAKAKAGAAAVRFVRHDLEQPLPLESAAFDRVMCGLVIDHIANLDGLFREMGRICRPDGFILVSSMHPAMMLRGIQARFTDPVTGRETRPASVPNQISDYVMAASRAGLLFEHMSEHAVDEALAAHAPRAQKYLGWLLLLMMKLRPKG
ncbi:MAG TPA: class I SAM-dependent methyltransferase [Phycisphaerae bacterium]|nr:class I SAM-dependent methyltransferase [Phycisphaerae bacterium]